MKEIGILLAIAALLGGLWAIYTGIDGRAYKRGQAEANEAHAEQQNAKLIEAQREILRLQGAVRRTEAKGAADQDAIATGYQEDLKHAHAETARLLAAVRSGDIRLFDPGAVANRGCTGGGDGGGTTVAAGAGGADGAGSGGGLSREAGEFLFAEAARANAIVRKLRAARAVILNDREICNAALGGA